MAFIQLNDIQKTFGKKDAQVDALRGITMELKEGEMVAVMGKSGSGKSTLLNIIGGLTSPTSGKYFFREQEMNTLGDTKRNQFRRENIGFIVQHFALIDDMDVYHNISLALRHRKMSRKEIKERVCQTAEHLGIADKLKAFPDELSGGQKQRTAIARAIVKNADLILADEPTGALDSQTAQEILKIFRMLNNKGSTLLIVTHDIGVAKQCDRIIKISDGRIE